MPTRPVIVVILLGWVVAAAALFRRDILPDLGMVPPPDLRSVAGVDEPDPGPSEWNLSVIEKEEGSRDSTLRPVGHATTSTQRDSDGTTTLKGQVTFDSDGLLRGTGLDPGLALIRGWGRLEIDTTCKVDPVGHLDAFVIVARQAGGANSLLTINAQVVGHTIEVVARALGPFGQSWHQSLPYEPRGLVQNSLGPIDRLPGLQVGQRWDTDVVNPITGGASRVRTEVTGKVPLQWNNQIVTTLEVVQTMDPFRTRIWVRRDGVVLRQEIPNPICNLVLERLPAKPDRKHDPMPGASASEPAPLATVAPTVAPPAVPSGSRP